VPVVALTACLLASDRERCLAAGSAAYLAEPVRGDDLRRVVDRLRAAEPADATLVASA
jgi:CheY-like chemotaxis protein